MDAFREELAQAPGLREKIVKNLSSRSTPKIVTNLFTVEYDFADEQVGIFYFVEDPEFPDVNLSFDEFEKTMG